MTPNRDTVTHALSLPYSIGAHRLLREILSATTDIPLPSDPPVRHGPVKQPYIPPRPASIPPATARRAVLLDMLRSGTVREGAGPPWPWHTVVSDVQALRKLGYAVRNTNEGKGRQAGARYTLTPNP
jgi:hypothetical protein